MADSIDFDFSEVERLVVNIGRANAAAVSSARGVVRQSLDNIKQDTVKNIPDEYWGKLKKAMNYDVIGLEGVVGYNDFKQGELAGIYEFGSVHRAPHPTLYPAADRELPKFEKAMDAVVAFTMEKNL